MFQIVSSTDLKDYMYYFIAAPWLSVKLLRLLQSYGQPGKCVVSVYHQCTTCENQCTTCCTQLCNCGNCLPYLPLVLPECNDQSIQIYCSTNAKVNQLLPPIISDYLLSLTDLFSTEDGAVYERLKESLETILNRATDPPKSKKIQHTNAKNAVLFEAISLIIHYDRF